MYFRFSLRYNKDKQQSDACYRFVESYRNSAGRVCHRTISNIGFIDDDYSAEQLNQTARQAGKTSFTPDERTLRHQR